jgi:exopolyphosphatase / guanosine-5'-triphosphate,3'-diphosphate pyrophosphatase
MQTVRRAIIDIGTNSVKLLVADLNGRCVTPVWEGSEQTRLGRGFYRDHQLARSAIEATSHAASSFALKARELNADSIRVLATSAAREARNVADLVDAIRKVCGLEMQIVTGEQEADLAFQGVGTDSQYAEVPFLLLEVGGGSTQFILGRQGKKSLTRSYQIGAVRLMEAVPHNDPPGDQGLRQTRAWLMRVLDQEIAADLEPELKRVRSSLPPLAVLQLIASGGTASILGCMEAKLDVFDRDRLEAVSLNIDRLQQNMTLLWSLPLEERRKLVGLPPSRADVILTGAAIYEAIMTRFGFQELRISTRGLRFGAALLPPSE